MSNSKNWFKKIENSAKPELYIYDFIGMFGILASDFKNAINEMNDSDFTLRINSPGGDVFEGLAIYSLIKNYKGNIDVVVDGLAASIASVIAMAGKTITMTDTSMMMVHKPSTRSMGDANQLRKDAEILDKVQEQIRLAYVNKTGLSADEVDAIINTETWFTAQEAIDKKFADNIISTNDKIENKISNFKKMAFKDFVNIPSNIAACLIEDTNTNTAENTTESTQESTLENNNTEESSAVNENIEPSKELKPKETQMTEEEKKALQESAILAERSRQKEILASAKKLNITDSIANKAIEDGLTLEVANKLFIENFTANHVPTNVSVGADASDKFIIQNSLSLSDAAGVIRDQSEKAEARKSGGARGIHSLYRTIANRHGIKVDNLDGVSLVNKIRNDLGSIGTSELTSVLQDTMNKALDLSMATANTTYDKWTATKSVKDFKQFSLVKLSGVSNIKKIKENDSFKIASLSDKKEVGSLSTSGILLPFSREAQVNDDLGALTDMSIALGRGIKDAQERECYEYLYGTGGAGPTMSEDSIAMFDVSTHGNYITSGGSAPSNTSLDAAVLAFMTRPKFKARPDDKNEPTGLIPRFLICGPKHKFAAERIVYSPNYPVANFSAGVYNSYNAGASTPLQVIVVPYLNALDADGWYLASDPLDMPNIIRLTLNGNETPFIEKSLTSGDDPLGINFRCYHDWGFMAGDWRSMYLNDGDA